MNVADTRKEQLLFATAAIFLTGDPSKKGPFFEDSK